MLTIDLDKIKIKDGDTILDLGCGRGRHIHKLYYYKKCHVIGLDLSLEDIKITYQGFETYPDITNDPNRHFNLMTGNALSLPFKDETFDQIICSEVLEHIPNYEKVINENIDLNLIKYILKTVYNVIRWKKIFYLKKKD